MNITNFLCSIIILVLILAAIGYFMKKISERINDIKRDVENMKPKVKVLWEQEMIRKPN